MAGGLPGLDHNRVFVSGALDGDRTGMISGCVLLGGVSPAGIPRRYREGMEVCVLYLVSGEEYFGIWKLAQSDLSL